MPATTPLQAAADHCVHHHGLGRASHIIDEAARLGLDDAALVACLRAGSPPEPPSPTATYEGYSAQAQIEAARVCVELGWVTPQQAHEGLREVLAHTDAQRLEATCAKLHGALGKAVSRVLASLVAHLPVDEQVQLLDDTLALVAPLLQGPRPDRLGAHQQALAHLRDALRHPSRAKTLPTRGARLSDDGRLGYVEVRFQSQSAWYAVRASKVRGSNGLELFVADRCTCPDHTYRASRCKHMAPAERALAKLLGQPEKLYAIHAA